MGAKNRVFDSHIPDHIFMGVEAFVNRAAYRQYHAKLYYTRRQKLLDYLGGQCVQCGAKDNLHFDHIDPTKKSFEIKSRMAFTTETKAELDKCQLLCRRHHAEKTARENAGFTHGTVYGWLKAKCRCAACESGYIKWQERRNKARRKREGPNRKSVCGTHSKYAIGCRCLPCKKAHTEWMREYRKKRAIGVIAAAARLERAG